MVASTLDFLLLNNEDLVSRISVCPHNNDQISSDHFSIIFELSYVRPVSSDNIIQQVYDFCKADFPRMNAYILNSTAFIFTMLEPHFL